MSSAYSSCNGSRHSSSPLRAPAAWTCAAHSSSLEIRPGHRRAERADDRAGQRRQVDQPLGALLDRPGQAVGEHEAPLGVGVDDLDRRAGARAHDVAGLHRVARRQVLRRPDHGDQAHRQAQPRDRRRRLQHSRAARHVELHVAHAPARA
jgi:hypothetical protein